jgi:hypothetical protein
MQLDSIVEAALRNFFHDISETGWRGREREMVSLFAFGHLLQFCGPQNALFDPAQIGIEVAVPQLNDRRGRKENVCKDLVIWPKPKMTCWDSTKHSRIFPASVLEWKTLNPNDATPGRKLKLKEFNTDVDWLMQTSKNLSDFTGFAILIDCGDVHPTLLAARVSRGQVEENWLVLGQSRSERMSAGR